MCSELEQIYKEGMEYGMAQVIEEGRKEGRKEGIKQGELKKAKEMACSLSAIGMPAEKIAEVTKVNITLIQEWLSGNTGLTK